MGVARHVRKLVLILGKCINMHGDNVPHPAIEDGSLTTIMNTVFRGDEGYPYSTSDYTLALWGFAEWEGDPIGLLDTRITTLELKYLHGVPPTMLKGRQVKHISISNISFQWTLNSQDVPEYTALGPWKFNHLESLDILGAQGFFDLITPGEFPMLKALSFTLNLEDLTLNFYSEHVFPGFRVDYRHLSRLTRLTINLLLVKYNTSSTPIESSTHQILNLLDPHLPPLSRLEIFIDRGFISDSILYQEIGLVHDIPTEIDCAAIDAVLAQHAPSAISTIALRFRITLWRDVGTALSLETFRQDGLAVLREAEVSTTTIPQTWEDRGQVDVLQYRGMFSVEYTTTTT
ncbi:hypothetical protein BJ912DRAFT_974671 [Pholiota molesta]|nr:hypothetical protein BJ912DRAFT_974671 [Pholiota molesta]